MLHFLVVWIKNHEIRLPNLKNVCYIFWVFDILFDIFPKRSQKIAMVQKCPNIGIRIKHDIRIYKNDSECRMGMNGEDMIG